MDKEITAVPVGQWKVAAVKKPAAVLLTFEFEDREPMNFAVPANEAGKIAAAIKDALKEVTRPA